MLNYILISMCKDNKKIVIFYNFYDKKLKKKRVLLNLFL